MSKSHCGGEEAVDFGRLAQRTGYHSVCGRVILAYRPKQELDRYVQTHPIRDAREPDVRNRRDLDRILEQARRDGYLAYLRDDDTILAIAAPIRDHTGRVTAAVGAGIPSVRCRKSQKKRVIHAVRDAGRVLSTRLGYAGATE